MLLVILATFVASSARAKEPPVPRKAEQGSLHRIEWSRQYRRVGVLDYILTGVGVTATIVTRTIGPTETGPRGGVWVDEDVRDSLRASGFRERLLAEDISDVLLGVASSHALVIDPLVNAAWLRDSPDVGKQLFWMNAEVIALTLGVQQTLANRVGRERPYVRTCGTWELDERTQHCKGNDRNRSFFSGHTSVPFSVAAATCVHHTYLPLSAGHAWVPCSLGVITAAASGTLRIVSDNHYATDVMTGALVGTAIGLTVPLVHYTTGMRTPGASWGRTQVLLFPSVFHGGRGPMPGIFISGVMP